MGATYNITYAHVTESRKPGPALRHQVVAGLHEDTVPLKSSGGVYAVSYIHSLSACVDGCGGIRKQQHTAWCSVYQALCSRVVIYCFILLACKRRARRASTKTNRLTGPWASSHPPGIPYTAFGAARALPGCSRTTAGSIVVEQTYARTCRSCFTSPSSVSSCSTILLSSSSRRSLDALADILRKPACPCPLPLPQLCVRFSAAPECPPSLFLAECPLFFARRGGVS